MKIWNYSFYLSILAFIILIIIFFLPVQFSIFKWNNAQFTAGNLFPVILFIWALALVAFAMNNVFIDKEYLENDLKMPAFVKYLPSILGAPVFFSFIWFLYTWMKAIPNS